MSNRPSFVNQPRPGLVCVMQDPDPATCISTIRNGECSGATGFDLHLRVLQRQYHNEKDLTEIIMASYLPIMSLFYRDSSNTWGNGGMQDEELAEGQLLAVKCGVSACDIMGDFYDPGAENQLSMKPEIIDRQNRLIDRIHKAGAEVTMSTHIWRSMSCDEVVEHMLKVEQREADMIKIAYRADTEDDLVEAIKTTVALKRALKKPFIHILMGQYGKMHRVLGPMFGSALTFVVNEYAPRTHKEQPILRNVKAVYDNLNYKVARNVEQISAM